MQCPSVTPRFLPCPPKETRQYLVWEKDGEEEQTDHVCSELFRAAEGGDDEKDRGRSTKRKGSKREKGRKAGKKRKASSSSGESSSNPGSSSSTASSDTTSKAGISGPPVHCNP